MKRVHLAVGRAWIGYSPFTLCGRRRTPDMGWRGIDLDGYEYGIIDGQSRDGRVKAGTYQATHIWRWVTCKACIKRAIERGLDAVYGVKDIRSAARRAGVRYFRSGIRLPLQSLPFPAQTFEEVCAGAFAVVDDPVLGKVAHIKW